MRLRVDFPVVFLSDGQQIKDNHKISYFQYNSYALNTSAIQREKIHRLLKLVKRFAGDEVVICDGEDIGQKLLINYISIFRLFKLP